MEWMLMPLKRYADFSGRSRRMEFWMWVLFQFLITLAFMIVIIAAGGAVAMSGDPTQLLAVGGLAVVLYILMLLLGLAFLIPNLAVTVRRLHDTDRSGWWIMLYWGPIFAMFFAAVVLGAGAAANSQGGAIIGAGLYFMAWLAWLVGAIVLLVFMFLEGTRGPNRYGPDPKGENAQQVFA